MCIRDSFWNIYSDRTHPKYDYLCEPAGNVRWLYWNKERERRKCHLNKRCGSFCGRWCRWSYLPPSYNQRGFRVHGGPGCREIFGQQTKSELSWFKELFSCSPELYIVETKTGSLFLTNTQSSILWYRNFLVRRTNWIRSRSPQLIRAAKFSLL